MTSGDADAGSPARSEGQSGRVGGGNETNAWRSARPVVVPLVGKCPANALGLPRASTRRELRGAGEGRTGRSCAEECSRFQSFHQTHKKTSTLVSIVCANTPMHAPRGARKTKRPLE